MTTIKKDVTFRLNNTDKDSIRNELYCTICGISIKPDQKVEEHPVLKVAVCNPCLLQYKAVNFKTKNNLCLWCGDNNSTLRKCLVCKASFCGKCLRNNLDDKGNWNKWNQNWLCLKCDPKPIRPLRSIFLKAKQSSRQRRSSFHERILGDQQTLGRSKRSKSIGCLSSLGSQTFQKNMKNAKKPNYQSLQEFLRNIAENLEYIFNESKSSISDFKLDVFKPYTTQISQLKMWFTHLCMFIDSVTENLDLMKSDIIKECADCAKYDGISLLSDYINKLKENEKQKENTSDSTVLPSSSSSNINLLQFTSEVQENQPKELKLSLKKRKLIFSSDESSDEGESSALCRKTVEEAELKTKNLNHQSSEAAILKELEDSNKKREEHVQRSDCSETTEIYSPEFLTARESNSQTDNTQETIIEPNYVGLEICPETGNYIGGTVPDSSQSSDKGLTDSDTQSFVFDIPDNLSKSDAADNEKSETEAIEERNEAENFQTENDGDNNNLETNTKEDELLNIEEPQGEINVIRDEVPEEDRQQEVRDENVASQNDENESVNGISAETPSENGICERDNNQILCENQAGEVNYLDTKSNLDLDVSYSEEKIDITDEKPRETDAMIDNEGPNMQNNSIEEVKDEEDMDDQINKILDMESECTKEIDPMRVHIKKEYDTDEYEAPEGEPDENEKRTNEELLKKALAHLQSVNILEDANSEDTSSLEVSSDESVSDSDELNVVSAPKEQEKIVGQIVSLPLPQLVVRNSSDSDVAVTVINDLVEEKTEASKNAENNKSVDRPFVPKSCQVVLTRLPRDFVLNKLKEMKQKEWDLEDAELKRLMNFKTLDRKRRHSSNDEEKELKRPKKRVYRRKSTQQKETSSSSDNDSTSEYSDEDMDQSRSDKIEQVEKNKDHGDWMTLEEILKRQQASRFLSSYSEDSSDDSDQEENENKKVRKKKLKNNEENESKKDNNKEKKETSSWRNDYLLRQQFGTSSDSEDADSNEENKAKKVSKKKRELSPKTGDDDTDTGKSQEAKTNGKEIYSSTSSDNNDDRDIKDEPSDDEFDFIHAKPTKPFKSSKSIIVLSSSSDSDIEFVSNLSDINKAKGRRKSSKSEDGKEEDPLKKKGRRNIREILSDDVLQEETKKAIEEEKKRSIRVTQKQQLISNFLSQSSENLEEEGLILDVDSNTKEPLIVVDNSLSKRLKPHQSDGVKFMWTCCYESVEQIKQDNKGSGCILAHCMGLGKTFQVITLIHTLFKYPEETRTKRVLVVCPLSTVLNWDNEFKIAFQIASKSKRPHVHILGDHQNTMFRKSSVIKQWFEHGGILVMGYEAYSSALKARFSQNTQDKVYAALVDPGPDLVILDEGHLLKNGKTSRTTTLMRIKTKRRIILTGTPMQNNLNEYYHMVNFVKPNLLGSLVEYSNQFVNPIVNGQYDDSTEEDVRKMKYRSHVLNKKLKGTVQRFEVSELQTYLPPKLDYVLFVQLHPVQVQLYRAFLENLHVNVIQAGKIFAHYRYLQNTWTHPYLLVLQEKTKNMSRDKNIKEIDTIELDPEIEIIEPKPIEDNWWSSIIPKDVDTNIEYGPKFSIMLSIIEESISCGDKVIVFSNSLHELDAIEHFLKLVGTPSCRTWRNKIEYYRMDGTIKPDSRMSLCMSFNNPKNTQTKVFLVSHKVGGLGLNLVAANRVILMDVNWNPSYDSQSVFRTYRFGQEKTCHVYRLVSMGTMEEVVYERSIAKLAIAGRVVDERQIGRHYKSEELQKMYRANFDLNQPRPNLNVPEDVVLGKVYQKHTTQLFKYHSHQSMLENVLHECLTEEEMEKAWLEFGRENEEAAKKLEINKQMTESVKKVQAEIRYQKNIQFINSMAEGATKEEALLKAYSTMGKGNFVNIPNNSMSPSLLPSAYHAIAKENEKNLKTFFSNQMALANNIPPSSSNITSAPRTTSSIQVGHFEEVYVPDSNVNVNININNNRDNDVIVLEEDSQIDGRPEAPKDRLHRPNMLRNPVAKRRLVSRGAIADVPKGQVIDVENHLLLAKLAKNHDISVSQILIPKNSAVDDSNTKGNTTSTNSCDNMVETSIILG